MDIKKIIFGGSLVIGILFFVMGKNKAFAEGDELVKRLIESNPATLPTRPNSADLKVMGYAEMIWFFGNKFDIEPALIASCIMAESSGNPVAVREEPKIKDISIGLMQILTATANFIKQKYPQVEYTGNPAELKEPDVNIELGTAYLAYQLSRYRVKPLINPIKDAVAGYNAGTARIQEGAFVYVNSKGSTNVQTHVDKVFSYMPKYRAFFWYLWGYDNYRTLFPDSKWDYKKFYGTTFN